MSIFRVPTALALALLATSCAAPATPPATTSPFGGPVTVTGKLDLRSAGGYQLLEEVSDAMRAWEAADVDHLKVFLKRGEGTEVDLGEHPDRNAPLVLQNLRMDTAYTVRLEAYTADDTRIDDRTAACETTFTTTTDPTLELTGEDAFQVELADQTFAGQAAGNVAIADGALDDTEDDEKLAKTKGDPLFDLVPIGGESTVTEDGKFRFLALAAGTAQAYRSPEAWTWLDPDGAARTWFGGHTMSIVSWPIGGQLTIAHTTPAGAELGRFDAGAFRLRKTGADLITIDVRQGDAWVPHEVASIEGDDTVTVRTTLLTKIDGNDLTMIDRLAVSTSEDDVVLVDDLDMTESPLNRDGYALYLKFENLDAAAAEFEIASPPFKSGRP